MERVEFRLFEGPPDREGSLRPCASMAPVVSAGLLELRLAVLLPSIAPRRKPFAAYPADGRLGNEPLATGDVS